VVKYSVFWYNCTSESIREKGKEQLFDFGLYKRNKSKMTYGDKMKLRISELCKDYKERFVDSIAEWMIVLWMIIPLIMGIINYIMLLDEYYDAYVYYDCFKIIVALVLSICLVLTILYVVSRCAFDKDKIKNTWGTITKYEKWLLFWIALPIWSLLSVICSVNVSGAFWGVSYLAEGYMGHLFGLALMICASFICKKKEREKVLLLFGVITDIFSFIMLGYEYSVPFISGFSAATGVAVYANSNHFAYTLSMAMLCMAGMYFMYLQEDSEADEKKRKRKRLFWGVSFVFNTYALMINNTLGVYWAVVIGLVVIMVFWKVRVGKLSFEYFMPLICIVVFTIISFGGFLTNELGDSIAKSLVKMLNDIFKVKNHSEGYQKAGTNRLGLWIDAVKAIAKRPIVGYGPGIRYDSEWNEIIRTLPHNEYLECALFLGIPGAILYVGGLVSLCVDRCKKLKSLDYTDLIVAGALIGYLFSACVGARRFYTSPYMFVFLGMLIKWGKVDRTYNENKVDDEKKEDDDNLLAHNEAGLNTEEILQEGKLEVCQVKSEKEVDESNDENTIAALNKKTKGLFTKFEKMGISKTCASILLAWTVIPVIAAIGFVPIGLKHSSEGVLLHTYYQIMYNFSLVCIIGIIGFIFFMIVLSGKRDKLPMTTKQIIVDKAKKEVWIILLIVLLLWSFVSACLSDTVVTAFIGTALKRDGFFAYCMYASVFGIAYFIEDEKLIRKILIWYSGIANIMVLIMMCYEWGIPVISYMSHSFSCATFMNPNHFGYYLCMSIMCLAGLFYMDLYRAKDNSEGVLSRNGIFYIVSFGWQMYALMINNSLGAYVAIVIAIIVSLVFWKIREGKLGVWALAPVIITIVITFISYRGWINNIWGETVGESLEEFFNDIFKVAKHSEGFEHAGTNRMGLWIEAIKLIPGRPLFGYGPEGLTGHFQEINSYDRPHNEYLQLAVFCGIPALLMYLSALITLCVNRCKTLKTISPMTIAVAGVVIGYLVNAFFGFTLYYTTPYFFMFLGFVAGSAKNKTE